MSPLVCLKFLSSTKTSWADIDPVTNLAFGIRTFNAYGVGQVAYAAIALYVEARLIHDLLIYCQVRHVFFAHNRNAQLTLDFLWKSAFAMGNGHR